MASSEKDCADATDVVNAWRSSNDANWLGVLLGLGIASLVILGGCIRIMPQSEIDAAARACAARGGTADFIHANRGQGPVTRVNCWGAL
jgi:hypothetical protein